MKLSVRWIMALGAIGVCTVAAGVATADADRGAKTEESGATAAPKAHGLVQLVGEALAEVELTPEQEASLEPIGLRVEAVHAAEMEAARGLMVALADQLRSGCVDRAALTPAVEGLVEAHRNAAPVLRGATQELHAILTPEQRNAFADAAVRRIAERAKRVESGAILEEWSRDLDLTEAQKGELGALLAERADEHAEKRAKVLGVFEAFRCEGFSIDEAAPADPAASRLREALNTKIETTEDVAAVLTPEQRATAAEKILEKTEK